MRNRKVDFYASNYGSVWGIVAVTKAAKTFAKENFGVEPWQGVPGNFVTDWRVARDLVERLVSEGWEVV